MDSFVAAMDQIWNTTTITADGEFYSSTTVDNNASECDKPNDPPGFTDAAVPLVAAYCVMFFLAAGGNLSVIISLYRSKRHRRSRISLMICHLAVADLIVAFFMIPLEIGWRLTVEWKAGNVACKFFLFLRAFCLYLSSNVLVCVSLDRCFAVVYPLRVTDARRRGKAMLLCAWIIAMLNALPQSFFFRVQVHPKFPGFRQCVTFDSFSNNQTLESAYNLFCLIAMYFVPLLIISIAYSAIVCEISNRSNRQHNDGDSVNEMSHNGTVMLRCSALSQIQRARQRTFRLTITIVVGFIWCWTPYVVMASWYIVDKESASRVNTSVQDGLFLMAVSNSCLNPLIYSTYSMRRCRFPWTRKRSRELPKTELQRRSTDAGSVDPKHIIDRNGSKVPLFNNLKVIEASKVPKKNGFNMCPGTISRTSVLTKLTNARTNVQMWNTNNTTHEKNADTCCNGNNNNSSHRNNKNLLLFDDNVNCRMNYNKHHHSAAKNLSNSQLNSVTNTNSRTSRNLSGGDYGDSDDFEDSGMSGRAPANSIRAASSNRNLELLSTAEHSLPLPRLNGQRNAFYCISMGNITTAPSQSSINVISERPSFYSDPSRQCDFDGDNINP